MGAIAPADGTTGGGWPALVQGDLAMAAIALADGDLSGQA
jgi:hypothetical protein